MTVIDKNSLIAKVEAVLALRRRLTEAELELDAALASATDPGEEPPRKGRAAPGADEFIQAIAAAGGVADTTAITEAVYGRADRMLVKRTHSRLWALYNSGRLRRDAARRWVTLGHR